MNAFMDESISFNKFYGLGEAKTISNLNKNNGIMAVLFKVT